MRSYRWQLCRCQLFSETSTGTSTCSVSSRPPVETWHPLAFECINYSPFGQRCANAYFRLWPCLAGSLSPATGSTRPTAPRVTTQATAIKAIVTGSQRISTTSVTSPSLRVVGTHTILGIENPAQPEAVWGHEIMSWPCATTSVLATRRRHLRAFIAELSTKLCTEVSGAGGPDVATFDWISRPEGHSAIQSRIDMRKVVSVRYHTSS